MSIRINGVDRESTINEQSSVIRGAYHLADNPNLYEPQRTSTFDFIVTDLNGIRKEGMTGTESNSTIANAEELLRLSVASTSVPNFELGVIETRMGNSVVKFAGVPTFAAGTIVVNDWIGADTLSIVKAWRNLAYNVDTDKRGLASDYKKTCYLQELTPDLQVVRTITLYGCWVSNITETDFTRENDDKKQITCTIQYDKAKPDTSSII